MNLNARLNQLEKLAAAKRQKLKSQYEQEQMSAAIARFKVMDQSDLLADYERAYSDPLPVELTTKLEAMDTNELMKFYFETINHD